MAMGLGHFLQDSFLLSRRINFNPEIVYEFMIQSDNYFRVSVCPINIHNYVAIVNIKPQKKKNTESWPGSLILTRNKEEV